MASVHVENLKGGAGYRVRWRERKGEKDGRCTWSGRSRTVSSRQAAIELRAIVLRALETQGRYVDPVTEAAAKPVAVDPEDAALTYLQERLSDGSSLNSLRRWKYALVQWFTTVRRQTGVAKGDALEIGIFSRERIAKAKAEWAEGGLAPNTIKANTTTIVDLWMWMADDPDKWAGVPRPPTRRKGLIPQAPPPVPAPAPTLDEVDALIRELARDGRRNVTLRACIVGRFTGLRIHQILDIRRSDLDVDRLTLYVRSGKTRRDKVGRTIPVSPHLVAALEDVLDREGDQLLVKRVHTQAKTDRLHVPYACIHEAWQQTVEDGLVRAEVVTIPGRRNKKPFHALRAAFMAALSKAGVQATYIERLVGHEGSVASRHYIDDASVEEMTRAAVNKLPPINWVSRRA